MENKNFINQSLWAGSSPNQTGETQSRENRIGVFSYFYRTFVLLFMLLTIGVGQMWAMNVKKPIVYFNNQTPNWSTSNLYFAVGHNSYTRLYNTTTIPNTKLQYVNLGAYDCSYCSCDCQQWGDATYVAFCQTTSAWDQAGGYGYNNIKNAQKYSGQKNGYDMNDGNTYYCYMANADNGATLSVDYKNSGYSGIPKFNATQGAKWRDAGTSYSITTGTWPATLNLQGTYLSGDGKSTRNTIKSTASADGDAKKVYGAVVTGEITHSFESLNSSYYFEGWGTGSTPSSTENTYSYNISENTTTYAFFSKKYTLTYDRKGTVGTSTLSVDVSNFSGTKESGSAIPTGHQITFTATPADGYVIEGWYSDAECTKSLDNGQNTTYTISSLDADRSVYVKFEQLKTITIKIAHEVTEGWTIQGVRKYPTSGGQSISANGKWVTIEFTNVYAVSNIDLAYKGDDWDYLKTDTKITGDCCYNRNGSLNASCCVPPAYPTWGTAPKNGDKGGSMTATVSGAPAGATITWSSTHPSAATVNSSGVISYVAAGNTTIKANVSWSATGDYCAGSYELSQEISVTSGAMVSVERTCAAYVAAGVAGQVSAHITFTGTSSGWRYRIKQGWSTGYETGWLDASGTSADWTMTGGMDAGERTYTVELYTTEGAATPVSTANFSVTGETAYNTTIAAGANGSVSPSGTVYANSNNLHPTITATPDEHYHFDKWTSNNLEKASVADDKSAITTVTAGASGYTITANFAGDQYRIAYKDQGNVNYTGNNEGSLPATHTYGTATALENGTKDGYAFKGWFTTSECDGKAVTSLGATAYTNDITLYAKWGKNPSLTGLELSTSVVTTGNTFTATPTIDAGDGRTTNVCWVVKNSSDEEVSTTITPTVGNAVTITAPAAPGNYKVVATLREGKGCGGTVLNSLQQPFTVEGHYTVTITNGTGSENVGEETTATVTANPAADGKKFDHWTVEGTYTLQGGTSLTSREIQFTASTDISITAEYTERDSKTVYFAKPSGWSKVYAYAWENSNASNKNGDWTATDITSNTVTIKGTPYHYYQYYVDDNGEDGGDKTNQGAWDRIIFHNGDNSAVAQSTKTADLTLVDGHFYHIADGSGENERNTATVSGSASAEDWYVCGYWNQSTHDWGFAHPVDLNGAKSGSVVVTVTASHTQEFKIYRASTNEWFKWTDGPNADYYDNYAALIGDPMTLRIYDLNRNTFTSYATEYRFTLDITSPSNPVLTLTPNDNTPYSATLSKNGNGSLSVGTGAITLHQYIPTTITATPEPGYRFTGWTTTGSVAFADGTSSSNATASFTATDNGGTITANFSNSEVIYFDASGVSDRWGDEVYVTFFSHDFEWNNGNGALIVKNWVDNALYCVEMTRIPNTDIYYLDYSNLSGHERVTQYVLFTSKHFVHGGENNYYQLFEMAAVTRGDYAKNTTNNLFVAEDWREKDKNKTGYYVGYWMNYKQTDPGVYLDIHDGGSLLPDIPNFQLIDGSENEYTATYKLSGNNTYKLGLRGANGTYYNNDRSGTMTFSNCTGWSYVDRQKTPGGISTTADGEYKFTLTCGDKLTLSVEYPLSIGDYRIIYQGALEDTTSAPLHDYHPSKIIRQLSGGATERKDTVSFFVTGDWSITLQKCRSVTPNITWEDACGSATKNAAALGLSGKTGVYVFPLTLSSTGDDCDQITVGTPELYTGDYYIRTDVAKGGWEGYTRSLDNRMTYSDYAKHNSGFDYYNCQYAQTNKNVKFTIANDYSFCITDTLEGDAYVPKAGANIGKLPYQANIRFMYNSAKNTISRAYLNGSSETGENTFLYLQSTSNALEPDIYQSDGSDLVDNTIRFNDHNNWIYQIDIQANEQARVKLISNYRFNSTDHLQYFKGTDGDWSEATTSEIIGGDYSSYPNERHALRIIYDFKTNHLLSAWLVPESGPVPAAAINTNVMIIKQNQEDARQITFSSGNALTEVDTVYTAVLLTKGFLTDSVASEYAKQFYWVSFPYTVQINDIFGSVGTYGYDWILQRYNGKKRAANGFWIDSEPNWEFMDKSETLNPYEGYILTLDLGEFTSGSLKWNNNVTYLSLYFPSDGVVGNIKQTNVSVKYTDQSDYVCTITRDNRNIKDSYWHCIGSPSFAENTIGGWNWHENTDDTWKTGNLPFLYEWNSETNQLSPVAAGGYTFKPLTGYMVQYSGTSIEWANVITPSVSAPKRQNSAATDLTYKLQLVRGEEEVDHTFVRFSDDENITAAFEFNQDLCKEYKSGGNIYTITSDAIQVAGNSLPLSTTQTTVVPVGVKIKTAGDYTFSIPEGTDGIGVTLVDNETGVRTSLSALDYTVNLTAGTHDGRFILEISPIQNTPTDIENVQGDNVQCTKVRKVMIDGILYIVKDGKIFDARGARVE